MTVWKVLVPHGALVEIATLGLRYRVAITSRGVKTIYKPHVAGRIRFGQIDTRGQLLSFERGG